MAYQPLYQAPPKWQLWLAARWAAFCAWWMWQPCRSQLQAGAQKALGRKLDANERRSFRRRLHGEDLRWYAAGEDDSNDSSEGQQAAAVQQVGRHRAPEEPAAEDPWHEVPPDLTEQQHASHRGATADWSPTGELRQIMAGELSPVETLKSVVISTEIRVPETAALAADVHQALDGWDDLFKPGLQRIDAIIAAAAGRQYPKAYIAERAREATQSWPIVVPAAELVSA